MELALVSPDSELWVSEAGPLFPCVGGGDTDRPTSWCELQALIKFCSPCFSAIFQLKAN